MKHNYVHYITIISLFFVILGMLFIGCAKSARAVQIENEDQGLSNEYANAIADCVMGSTKGLKFEGVHLLTDSETGDSIKCMSWTKTGKDMVEIRIDLKTGCLISYIDTTHHQEVEYYSEITEQTALNKAHAFFEKLIESSLFSWPEDCEFGGLQGGDSHWTFGWHHTINGIQVLDDEIRVRIDPQNGLIRYLHVQWSAFASQSPVVVNPTIDSNSLSGIVSLRDVITDRSGPFFLKNTSMRCYDLAWKFLVTYHDNTILSAYVNADNGALLSYDTTNSYYGSFVLTQGRDGGNGEGSLNQNQTSALSYDEYFLETDNYQMSTWDNQVLVYEMADYWNTKNIIIYEGHGGGSEADGNFITCYGAHFTPSNIPSDMSQAEIVYTASCLGGLYTTYVPAQSLFLSNTALNHGAKAFFGFRESPYTDEAALYNEYFWSAAADGRDFATCQAYAGSFVGNGSNGLDSDTALYGNRHNSLSLVDISYNYNLGYGHIDDHFTLSNQPCLGPDQDYLRFYSYDSTDFYIVVAPARSDFDVVLEVYDHYDQIIAHVNSYGPGGNEMYPFWGTNGWYYIKIYSASSFGGAYTLNVYIVS